MTTPEVALGRTATAELWMCRLAGLPVSERWDRPPGPATARQTAVTALCVGGTAVLAAVQTAMSWGQESTAFTTYVKSDLVVSAGASVLATLDMASGDRSAPTRLAVRAESVRESMLAHGLDVAATAACRAAARFLLAMSLLCFSGSCVKYGMILRNMDFSSLWDVLILLGILISLRDRLLFWTVLYWSASQPLAELGILEDVLHELVLGSEPEPEEEPGLPERDPNAPERPEEDPDRPRPRPLTAHRCRLLIAVCNQANKLRLESNRWLHAPSCAMAFVAAAHFPRALRELLGSAPMHSLASSYLVVGLIVKLAPVCCAQLVKHRREVLVRKAAREADRTADPELRRALKKLKIHAEDVFPDSPCVLLDFDLSLLPTLLDVVLLVTTTFFQREDA